MTSSRITLFALGLPWAFSKEWSQNDNLVPAQILNRGDEMAADVIKIRKEDAGPFLLLSSQSVEISVHHLADHVFE